MTPRERRILAATILGSAMVFLDGTLVNIALARIGAELPAIRIGVLEGQAYVVSGYLATLAALLILGGAIGDRYGRRRTFAIGLAGFALASLACGLAPSMEVLAVARLLQGVAGALLVPGSLAIITNAFSPGSRGRAFGLWAAATSLVNVLGPPIGGIVVTAMSWRVAFLVNVPLALVALWLTVRFIPESRDEHAAERFDLLGAVLVVAAVGGLVFGTIRGQQQQWRDSVAFAALGIGVVTSVLLPLHLLRSRHPLFPPSLFADRRFAALNLATLAIYGALSSTMFFASLFLQGSLAYSPLAASMVFVLLAIALTLLSARVGKATIHFGARPFLVAGPLIMVVGAIAWMLIPAGAGWDADPRNVSSLVPPIAAVTGPILAMALYGVGMSCVVVPLTTALMASVPVGNSGVASAINNAISRVGQPFVSAVVLLLVTDRFYASVARHVAGVDPTDPVLRGAIQPLNRPASSLEAGVQAAARAASFDAFHVVMVVVIALLVAAAAISFVGLRESSPPEHRTAPEVTGD